MLIDYEVYSKDKMEKSDNSLVNTMRFLENQNKSNVESVIDESIFSGEPLDPIEKQLSTNTENISEKGYINLKFLNIFNSCQNCLDCIFFKFQNFKRITIECNCKLIKNCSVDEFINIF